MSDERDSLFLTVCVVHGAREERSKSRSLPNTPPSLRFVSAAKRAKRIIAPVGILARVPISNFLTLLVGSVLLTFGYTGGALLNLQPPCVSLSHTAENKES